MPGTIVIGDTKNVPFAINETDTLAGTSQEILAPFNGFVNAIYVITQKAVTTGGTVKVAIGTTDVVGATVTVPDASAKGAILSGNATKPSSTRAVTKGQRVQVIPDAAFATAGAVNGFVEFTSAQ
ncbi:hypothetical protein [Mesorhizobium sp. M0767]|uniref:hypothetical protein n=1 Tax=Mesorhizobium sp. M0767 TaxID=2956995 RepID=UPI003335B44E